MSTTSEKQSERADESTAAAYDAFVSYSHAADGRLAPAIQAGLQTLGKAWYRRRSLRVFRDKTSLAASPELWPSIERALGQARYFVLLASAEAAASRWVDEEVAWWRVHRASGTVLIAVTGSHLRWDPQRRDFDDGSAIPPSLRGWFETEPLWVDLRWARDADHVSLRNPRFRESVADLAAPIRGLPKDELIGEDIRQHRRALRLIRGGVSLLVVLAAAAAAAVVAVSQRNQAVQREQVAQSRQLAAAAVAELDADPALSVLLARHAVDVEPTQQAEDALRRAIGASHGLASIPAGERVWAVDFSPDGRVALTATADLQIRIWNWRTGRRLKNIRAPGARGRTSSSQEMPIIAVFDPSGRYVAVGSRDTGTVAVIEWRTGRVAFERGDYVSISAVAFSPKGAQLAVSSVGPGAVAEIWDWQTGRLMATFGNEGDTNRVFGVSDARFDRAGRHLVTAAGVGGVVRVWDWRARRLLSEFRPSLEFTERASFSPDGKLVVVASSDGSATVWRWRTQQLVADLRGHRGEVEDAAFTADGRYVVTAGEDRAVLVWDFRNEKRVVTEMRGHADRVPDVTISPTDPLAFSASLDGTARVWTRLWPTATSVSGPDERVEAFSPSGQLLLTNNADHTARLVEPRTGRTMQRFHEPRTMQFEESAGTVIRATISSDGAYIVTNSEAGARVWDATTGKSLATLNAPNRNPGAASIERSGQVVVPVYDGRLLLWDWRSGRTRALIDDRGMFVNDALLAASGDVVATTIGLDAPETRLMSPSSGAVLGSVPGAAAAFDSEARNLLTVAEQVRVWDVEQRRPLAVLRPPSHTYDAAFSADGRLVVSSHEDAVVRIWNWRTGQLVQAISARFGGSGPLAISADSRSIALNAFRSIAIYPCAACGSLDQLVAKSREYVTRTMSAEERERYDVPN